MPRRFVRPIGASFTLALVLLALAVCGTSPMHAQSQGRFLGREEITLYGIGLKVQPEQQTVPKGFATIVSTFLQTPQLPVNVSPFAPDAEVRATLRGPSFQNAQELVAKPNSPFNIPILTVPGTHTLENIRLISGGEVLLYGSPQSVKIEVIEKLLVTTVTARPLTAEEIREKGIVFDKSNYQAYNFAAAFAISDGSEINITFPVVLPTLAEPANASVSAASLATIDAPVLRSLATLIPDTLRIGSRIPNLTVTGFTLTLDSAAAAQDFYVPPIPGVIVIPGDIGFLNQFFSVMLMVANVAPGGSNLVVSNLTASIVLPPGLDSVVGSNDDPLRMAQTATGTSPQLQAVVQPGADGKLRTGDDIATLGPGETGSAEYLVEGRREGTWIVEMELAGTLNGMPTGPVPIRGRAAGVVLVRNPRFTLTFTHPDVVNAGEPYTLDVTVTNTTDSPANFVSVNLYAQNISGARLDDEPTKSVDYIAPNDSATMTFRLISQRTGTVTAATLDSADQVAGRFALKTGVGEFGIPLSPDSLVLPKEAGSLPQALRDAALGLLGRAWAVATAPPAAFPKDLERFSKQVVLDRAVETAEAGFRIRLGAPVPQAVADLWLDMLGSEYTRLTERVKPADPADLLSMLQADVHGFDLLRRKSVRGDVFAEQVAAAMLPWTAMGGGAFHRSLAEQFTTRPGHLSVLVAGDGTNQVPVEAVLVDALGRRLGGVEGARVVKQIPYGDQLTFRTGGVTTAQLLMIAVPEPGLYTVLLTRRADADPAAAYSVSVAYPGSNGRLRFAAFPGLGSSEVPALQQDGSDPYRLTFSLGAVPVPQPKPGAGTEVTDPPPTILGAVQMAEADVVGCSQVGLENRRVHAGRVVAVLFSEEVTADSVQDRLDAGAITAFAIDGNRVVDVALQPGNRIAYLALREPIGRFVPRTLTVQGVADRQGNVLGSASVPIQTTVADAGGVVSGQVLNADGTPAKFAELRLFYQFQCDEAGTVAIGIASEHADENGQYQFDYVALPVAAVKMIAINTGTDDLRTQRFKVARDGQLLNVNIVFLGRGAYAGRTLAEDGVTPLPNTNLRITSLTDQSEYGTTSDAEGRFEIQRIPVGNVLVEAVNTARPASVFVSDRIPAAGTTVTRDLILLDVSTTVITVKTGTITGRVLRADGVTRVPGVQVVAFYRNRSQDGVRCGTPPGSLSQGEPSECAIAIVTTGDDGTFAFSTITAGELRLYTLDQAALQQGGVRITLAEDQVFDLNLLMAGGFGTVHGVVLDASGKPVADAEVGGGLSLTKVNPADGTFTLTDVPVGRRELVAVSAALGATGRTTIDIVREGEVVNAAITLDAIGSVAGVVRDRDGVPQAGIHVYVLQACYDDLGNDAICVKGEASTDANGAYRVNALLIGMYTVSAFRGDMRDGNIATIAIRHHQQVLRADITFRGAGGVVTGRVLRARPAVCDPGQPCVETPLPARVAMSGDRLVTAGGRIGVRFEYVQNYAVVDNNFTTGEFSFSNVWTGPFTVRAAGQFSPEPVAAEGQMPGPGQTVNVDLRLQPTSVVTGTVLEPDGVTPVTTRQVSIKFSSNAVIVFCSEDSLTFETTCTSIPQGIQEAFAVTDATGRFSFPLVNAGTFTLTANDPGTGTGGHLAEIKGAVKAGETVDLSIRLLGRGRATVRVFEHNGQTPVLNAAVELQQIDYPKTSRTGTAVDGTIVFDPLGEGQFVVTALGPGGFAGRASGRISREGDDVVVNVYLYDATGTITGIVTRLDSAGAAVAVPNAEAVLTNSSGPIAYAVTDANGVYTVTLVPVGNFTVEAFDPVTAGRGRATGSVTGGPVPVEANVRLDALGVIRGVVLEAGTLRPLKGWQVRLSQTTPSGRGLPTLTTMTSVDGSYSFPGASVGTFTVSTSNSAVVGEASASGQVSRAGQLVEVPLVVTIVRRVTGSVAGTVVNPDGSRASSAQVDVCPASEGCRPTVNSSDGRFELADIPLGRFTVTAHAQVTGNQTVGTTGGTLLFEGDTAEVVVTLMGLSAVQGRVFEIVNGVQVPAANAAVQLYGQPGSGCAGACQRSTDGDGLFSFVNVPARTFTVTASKGGQSGSVGDVLNPGETKTGLVIVLAPTVSFRGRVRLANGSPAHGIVADLARGSAHLYAESDVDGVFSFDGVGTGAYSLLLQDPIGPGIAKLTGTIAANTPVDLGDILLDEQAPAVADTSPAAGAIDVGLTPEIRITFTEAVNPGTVIPANVSVIGPAGALTGILDVVGGDTVARFRLLSGSTLRDYSRYTIRVTGVEDRLGKKMAGETVASFMTRDTTPPSILETTPVPTASGVSIDTVVRVKYSEIIDPARFSGPAITVTGPQGAIEGRIDLILGNTVMVFTPARPLSEDAIYAVHVAAATDLSGVAQTSGRDFAFATTDRTPPQVLSLVAANLGRVIENTVARVTATVSVGDVAFVDFFINNIFALTSRTLPFVLSFNANPGLGAPGSLIAVSAVATDTSGNRGVPLSTSISVIADVPPTAAITEPVGGVVAGNGDRVSVKVRATDDVGVAQIGFRARTAAGTILAETAASSDLPLDRTAAFAFNVPGALPPGTGITVEATVVDSKGQATSATPVTLSVRDTVGPVVEITGVTSGERVQPGQHVTVVVTAQDAGKVSEIGFAASGAGVAAATRRPISPAQASIATSFSFDVPEQAPSNGRVDVSAYAIDTAGNRTDAAQKILPVADRMAPTATVRTASGGLFMVPGGTISVIVGGTDDMALATLALSGSGAFSFADSFSITSPVSTASHTFVINVPVGLATGATLAVTARVTDVSGNVSTPVSLTLTATSVVDVGLPPSVLLRAGEQAAIDVELAVPAAATTVVALQSSAPGVATVTPSVTFAVGDTNKSATVTGVSGGTAQVSALISGVSHGSTTISVRGGIVTGSVGDPDLVAGAQVTILHGGTPITAVTDQNGAFDVEGVVGTGGTGRGFSVRATNGDLMGYTDAFLSVSGGFAAVHVVLVPLSTIVGTVRQADGTTPAGEGVRVDLYEAARTTTVVGTTFTDAQGRYELRLVAPGGYILEASDLAGNRGRAVTTIGTSGQEITANITFVGRGTVTGTVRDGAGNVVPFAQLYLNASSIFGSAPERTGTASETGTFSFGDVFIGNFSVTAYDPVTTKGGSVSGQIASAGQTVDVTVQLASYGNVEGTVFRSDGITRAAGATVTVRCGGAVRSTSTDTNGHYAFALLPFASFTIVVNDAATRALGATSGSGFPTSGATVTADIVLRPQGAVLVTVVNHLGAPVNGATVNVSVSATVSGVPLTDSLSAQTGPLNSVDGMALMSPLMVGPFSATASAGGLVGSAAGVVTEGGQTAITIQIQAPPPTGTITGTVRDQDGQTPAIGSVRAVAVGAPYTNYSAPLVGGSFSLSLVRLGTYRLEAFDANNRLRAVATGVAITADGQVETRDLVFVGLGRVLGIVTNPFTNNAAGVTVQVRSYNATFGGAWAAITGAAGEYVIAGVPVGPITVAAWSADGLLRAEATRSLTQPAQDLTVDLVLENNTFTNVAWLYDANDSSYAMQPSGFVFAGGVKNIFAGGAAWLDIIRDGGSIQFAGQSYGTLEDGGRETVGRQVGLHGLNVTRKFFVPENGYFVRVLETLTNPTTADITVDVVVTSNTAPSQNGAGPLVPKMTSSGNITIEINTGGVHDHWVVLDDDGNDVDAYSANGYGVPVSFVYDGPGASKPVTAMTVSPVGNQVAYSWQGLTVPAGGTVRLMHFVAQQVNRGGAIESAGRLVQLPPEALYGLGGDELASIVNFAVPADGTSTLAPLPALTGSLDGHVFEGDGLTTVPGAPVYFRSLHPLFGRVWTSTADASGRFTFSGAPRRPAPLDGFEIRAKHPAVLIPVYSPFVTGTLSTVVPALTVDLAFSDTGMLAGVVRRHTGAPVTSGSVTVSRSSVIYATVAIGADGRYSLGGLPASASTYNLVANLPGHPQGTGLKSLPATALIVAEQVTTVDIPVEPTGRLEGTLVDAAGLPVASRSVEWYRLASGGGYEFRRVTNTDTAGRFVSDDMPVGTYTLRSYMLPSNFAVTKDFTIVQDATTQVTLAYGLPGTLRVHVSRANGAMMPGVTVTVHGSGFSLSPVTSDASGTATVAGIPVGQPATVDVEYNPTAGYWPNNPNRTQAIVTLAAAAGGFGDVNVTLPPFGRLTGTVRTPGGALAGTAARISLPVFQRYLDVPASSVYVFDGVPIGQAVTIRTGKTYKKGYIDATATIANDGDVVTVDTRMQALAAVAVSVQNADGSLYPSAVVYLRNEFYPFSPCDGYYNQTLRAAANASGVATFSEISEGPFALRVYPPGTFLQCYSTNPPVIEGAFGRVIQTDDAGTVPLTVRTYRYSISVHGIVTLADGTTPWPNLTVQMLRASDTGPAAPSPNYYAVTTASGEFAATGATVTGAGLLIRATSPGGTGNVDTLVPVNADGLVEARVILPALVATVIGQVLASDGLTPISQPLRVVLSTSTGVQLAETTLAQGSYSFASRPLGTEGVKVRVYLPGLTGGYLEQASSPITQNNQQLPVNLRLPASVAARITGRVVTIADHQTPLRGGSVELLRRDNGSQITAMWADADGRYAFNAALPADGLFTIRASSAYNSNIREEQNGAATEQSATIDMAPIELRVSVVTGYVRFADGAPVPSPTVIGRSPDGSTWYAERTDTDGRFLFLGLPMGAHAITAQDGQTGLTASVDVVVASPEALVTVDLTMPPTGTVIVTVVDENGARITDATLALVSDQLSFERRGGASEAVRPDSNGRYVFARAPIGGIYVQGRRVGCGGGCQLYASASGTLVTPDQTLNLAMSFQYLGVVQGVVRDNPTPAQSVEVFIDALGSAGPLGSYSVSVSSEPDTGVFAVGEVPPGLIVVRASSNWSDPSKAGQSEGTLAVGAPDPLILDVRLGSAVSFGSYSSSTIDLLGQRFRYSVGSDGTTNGSLPDGNLWGTLSNGAGLSVGGGSINSARTARTELDGRQVVIGPASAPGLLPLQVTRKVYVPTGGLFARYFDVITNPTGELFSTSVALSSESASGVVPGITWASPISGAAAVFDGVANTFGTAGHVFSGADAPVPPSSIVYGQWTQVVTASWRLSVPPHGSVALLNFVALDLPETIDAMRARTHALATLTEPGALDGLTDQELALVVNYRRPGSYAVNLRGTLLAADGTRRIPNATVQVYQESGNRLLTTLTSASDGSGAFNADNLVVRGGALVLRTPGATGTTLELRVPISGDGDVPVSFVTDWMYASVRGIVLTSDGSGGVEGGFRVQLLTLNDRPLGETTLGGDSTFAFGPVLVPAEGAKVRVFMPGLPGGFAEVQTGPVTEDGQQMPGDITLPGSLFAIFQGRIRSVGSDEGVETAPVFLLRGDNRELIAQTTVGRDGVFHIAAALPPDGAYIVRVESPTGSGTYAEMAGTAAGQRAWIEGPDYLLPITTATGFVTFFGGTAVPWPTVFVVGEDGVASFATLTRDDGTFAFYELPVGTHRLTAQDPSAGLIASRSEPFTLDTTTSSASNLNWEMPETGTVTVTAYNNAGVQTSTATVALVSDGLAFERRIGPNDALKPVNGSYIFEHVPFGAFYLQATLEFCDGGNCRYLFASSSGELLAGNTPLASAVRFDGYYGQVRVNVTNPGTGFTLFVLVPLGSAGPLGTFGQAAQIDASTMLFGWVPPGQFYVMARQDSVVGVARGVLEPNSPAPAEVDVVLGNGVDFTTTAVVAFDDEEGFRYSISTGGAVVSGGTTSGTLAGTLFNAATLHVGDNPVCCVVAADRSAGGRQLTIGPMSPPTARGLVITRKVFVSPATGGRSFARYLDRVTNQTDVPITVKLSLRSAVTGAGSGARGVSARVNPSATTGGYAVISGVDGTYGTSAYVFSGVNPPIPPSLVAFDFTRTEVVRYDWTLTITPHSSVALLHFVAQRMPGDETGTQALAQDLVDLTENSVLAGLSAEDLADIVNFNVSPAPVTIALGSLRALDGTTPFTGPLGGNAPIGLTDEKRSLSTGLWFR